MFKKLLPSLFAIGGAALNAAVPSLQHAVGGFASAHPAILGFIVSAGAFFYHLLPSPAQK